MKFVILNSRLATKPLSRHARGPAGGFRCAFAELQLEFYGLHTPSSHVCRYLQPYVLLCIKFLAFFIRNFHHFHSAIRRRRLIALSAVANSKLALQGLMSGSASLPICSIPNISCLHLCFDESFVKQICRRQETDVLE